MQVRRVGAVLFALALLSSTPAVAQVQLAINGGRVSVSAKNATVVQILAEWAKVGQTRIVNPERVVSGPLTLELTDVSELEALDILLRSAGGYLLAPRLVETANASKFDRILILPAGSARPAPTAAVAPPLPRQPQFVPPQMPSDDSDDPNAQPPAAVNGRPPTFETFPQPQRVNPSTNVPASAPTSSPTAPPGVSIPGMVVPSPTPPQGQPGMPTAPPQ